MQSAVQKLQFDIWLGVVFFRALSPFVSHSFLSVHISRDEQTLFVKILSSSVNVQPSKWTVHQQILKNQTISIHHCRSIVTIGTFACVFVRRWSNDQTNIKQKTCLSVSIKSCKFKYCFVNGFFPCVVVVVVLWKKHTFLLSLISWNCNFKKKLNVSGISWDVI